MEKETRWLPKWLPGEPSMKQSKWFPRFYFETVPVNLATFFLILSRRVRPVEGLIPILLDASAARRPRRS